MELFDRETCYRALQTRDARFDGRIFVGVASTGIYCRPVCPARTPREENCRFFSSAAAAQEAGFRPCLRCRPESAPDLASWRGTSNTVSRALALISDGGLDGEANVDELAARLGLSSRQLRRLFKDHLGASPVAVAQTRRVLLAKQLIHETRLPMTEVALAAGFGSVRRFNETFQTLFRRPPSALRGRSATDAPTGSLGSAGVTLRIRYRPPYDWHSMLAYLDARTLSGVEELSGAVYCRTVTHDGESGVVEVSHEPARNSLAVSIRFPNIRALPFILAKVRRVFDVGADVEAIGQHLSRDPFLAPLVASRPGLRAPGGWEGFELAVRAVLGQQISVAGARVLGSRLVEVCGARVSGGIGGRLDRLFPAPQEVVAADLSSLGMPQARRAGLVTLAEAAIADPLLFSPFGTIEESITKLKSIRGVGEWTAQYIALRALREPDAFPAGDAALLKSASVGSDVRSTPGQLLERAELWRPWRAYAAQHLWVAAARMGRNPRAEGDL